jgi:hypothetical protein
MVSELAKCGVAARELPDGLEVDGLALPLGGGPVAVRARATGSWGSPGFRRAPFSTLHLVERRRALVGATNAAVGDADADPAGDPQPGGVLRVPAPGGLGVDVRVEASAFDAVLPLVRVHTGPAPGENVVEAGVVVDVDPVRVSVVALRRGWVDAAGIVSADLTAVPLIGALEASVRVWGPVSVGARWLRLPRFRGDGPLRIDDDVWAAVSVNGVFGFSPGG